MQNVDFSHLTALEIGLSHERARLAAARKAPEIALRTVWVAQYEKEIAGELKRLGLAETEILPEMSDDELLAELMS